MLPFLTQETRSLNSNSSSTTNQLCDLERVTQFLSSSVFSLIKCGSGNKAPDCSPCHVCVCFNVFFNFTSNMWVFSHGKNVKQYQSPPSTLYFIPLPRQKLYLQCTLLNHCYVSVDIEDIYHFVGVILKINGTDLYLLFCKLIFFIQKYVLGIFSCQYI